jgi:serine phosphatase RsbU (regulator of sigma subunit)
MSHQIICDGCGEVIDQSISYYTASVSTVQMIDGALISGGSAEQHDYHTEHLPVGVSPSAPIERESE